MPDQDYTNVDGALMLRRNTLGVAACAVLAVASISVFLIRTQWRSSGLWGMSTGSSTTDSGLEMPDVVDIGPVKNGSIVPVPIKVTNHGRAAVKLTEFHASCACMNLFRLNGGAKIALSELTVSPGSSETFYSDLRVSGDPGSGQGMVVQYKVAAPGVEEQRHTVGILFTPVARVYAVPRMVAFGEVEAGTKSARRVELRSDGTFQGDLKSLSFSRSSHLAGKFEEASPAERNRFAATSPGQHLLGYVTITLISTDGASRLRDTLTIQDHGEGVCEVPVSATTFAEVAFRPATLVMPRSASGKFEYSATVRCVARSGSGFKVEALPGPAPFTIGVEEANGPGAPPSIRVEYNGPRDLSHRANYLLDFNVYAGTSKHRLSLPVIVLPDPH